MCSKGRFSVGVALFAIALAAGGCKVKMGESEADASVPGSGKKALTSAGKGEYKGISTGKVDKGEISVLLPEVGTLSPVSKVDVKSVLSGKVVKILVKEGEVVKAGQSLAILEPGVDQLRELSATVSGVDSAALELKDAKTDLDNVTSLRAKGYSSADELKAVQKRYDQAQITWQSATAQRQALAQSGVPLGAAGNSLKTFNVASPSDGTVLSKKVEVGEVVTSGSTGFNSGTILFEVADAKDLKVDAFVNEVDLGKIAVGFPVKITVDAFRGKDFKGEVATIAPGARREGEIRGFDVEVRLKGDIGPLRPGMTANIDIKGDEKKDVVRIPVESLFKDKGDDVVWVFGKDGKPARTQVMPGLVSLEFVEVAKGLEPGTDIALESPTAYLETQKEKEKQGH
jgi:HlyD family secretion protein